jgi:hypothetical protein
VRFGVSHGSLLLTARFTVMHRVDRRKSTIFSLSQCCFGVTQVATGITA